MLSKTGIGLPSYFEDKCVLIEKSLPKKQLKKIRKGLKPAKNVASDEACVRCLSQFIPYDNPLTYTRGKDLKTLKKDLLTILWDCETSHRKYQRFSYSNLKKFIQDLQWDNAWIMPEYAKHVFLNPPSSSAVLCEFVSENSALVRVLSALPFYRIKQKYPHYAEAVSKIFERLDHTWNPHSGQISISYPYAENFKYQKIFELLGYSLITEIEIDRHNVLAQYQIEGELEKTHSV